MPNRFQPIPPGTSSDQSNSIINRNFAELDNENVKKLFYDENGVPSISIGVQPDKTSRILVSKPGIDVTTATDDQLAFNSAQNVFKIAHVDTIRVVKPANQVVGFESVTHSLGYTPAVLAFLFDEGSSQYLGVPFHSFIQSGTYAGLMSYRVNYDVTDSDITITIEAPNFPTNPSYSNEIAVTVKYYLLQETAN